MKIVSKTEETLDTDRIWKGECVECNVVVEESEGNIELPELFKTVDYTGYSPCRIDCPACGGMLWLHPTKRYATVTVSGDRYSQADWDALKDAEKVLEEIGFMPKKNSLPKKKRVIVASAIKYSYEDRSFDIIVGARHYDRFMQGQLQRLPGRNDVPRTEIQGFIDNRQNFLNRAEALAVAEESGQIIYKHFPKDELTSEDIY